jgi:hypothetical protein
MMSRLEKAAWIGLFAGPAAWAVDLVLSYAFVHRVHASNDKMPFHLITLGAFAVIALGAAADFRFLRSAQAVDRTRRFVAASGLTLNAFFFLLVFATALAKLVHRAGD